MLSDQLSDLGLAEHELQGAVAPAAASSCPFESGSEGALEFMAATIQAERLLSLSGSDARRSEPHVPTAPPAGVAIAPPRAALVEA